MRGTRFPSEPVEYHLSCFTQAAEKMGQYLPGSFGFGMGTIVACFQLWGTVAVCQDLLITCKNASSPARPKCEMMGWEIPSDPGADPELVLYDFLSSPRENKASVSSASSALSLMRASSWI